MRVSSWWPLIFAGHCLCFQFVALVVAVLPRPDPERFTLPFLLTQALCAGFAALLACLTCALCGIEERRAARLQARLDELPAAEGAAPPAAEAPNL